MRYLLFCCCLMLVMSLVSAAPAEARGGKGGGGQGRGSGGGGGKAGGGRPQGSGQQAAKGGGKQSDRSQKQSGGKQIADKKHDLAKNKDRADKVKPADDLDDNLGDEPTDGYNKKQQQLGIEQRNRDKRIAQAQHLREIAERNGNQNLLANADRMEAAAHEHYARRVAQLEKFGVTDPLLDGGGDTGGLLPDGSIDYPIPVPASP